MKWVSFESTATLEKTKRDIYGQCVPCITNLYEQLKEGKKEVRLGRAFSCWKIVAVLNDEWECMAVLEEFEKRFLKDRRLKGRYGSGRADERTKVIVFSTEDENEMDRIVKEVRICTEKVHRGSIVFSHKACAELYHDLLGDWRLWSEVETVKRPELIDGILERIRKMLYWETS